MTTNGCFVSGISASAVHFQAYLVEGLVRWNAALARTALQGREGGGGGGDGSRSREGEGHLSNLQWLDVRHQHRLMELTPPGHVPLLPDYRPPCQYTGRIFHSSHINYCSYHANTFRELCGCSFDCAPL